jgi:hypothetical protein
MNAKEKKEEKGYKEKNEEEKKKEENEEKENNDEINNSGIYTMLKKLNEKMDIIANDISQLRKEVRDLKKEDGINKKRRRGNSVNDNEEEDKEDKTDKENQKRKKE